MVLPLGPEPFFVSWGADAFVNLAVGGGRLFVPSGREHVFLLMGGDGVHLV